MEINTDLYSPLQIIVEPVCSCTDLGISLYSKQAIEILNDIDKREVVLKAVGSRMDLVTSLAEKIKCSIPGLSQITEIRESTAGQKPILCIILSKFS